MLPLIAVHCVAACCAPPLVRRLGPRAFLLLAAAPAAAALWAAAHCPQVAGGGHVPVESVRWIPVLGVQLAFRGDALSLLMVLVAGGVGALVMVYCAGYFAVGEPRLGLFAAVLTAFAGTMIGLVTADDLITLYVLWELTSVISFLLIGHDPERRVGRLAALQALLVTTLGGLAMLVGFLVLGRAAGTYRLSALLAHPPHPGTAVSAALLLVLAGALSKSAVWPFSLWLPGAMAAPTPVSAYLHAAAMVKAGIYLIARLAPAFDARPAWQDAAVVLGAATALLGGWRALREDDLKRLLAYGTVGQLGLLTVLAGTGTRDAALATVALILAHALFKAALFLVVGIVEKRTGTRRLGELGGLAAAAPGVCAVAVLAGMSMAGLPPLYGFAAKEAAAGALLHGGGAQLWSLAAVSAGSALTVAYTLRLVWGVFGGRAGTGSGSSRTPPGAGASSEGARRTGVLLLAPPAVCAAAGLVLGPGAAWTDGLLARYADAFAATPGGTYRLALWHGAGPVLALSVAAIAAGAALFLANRPLAEFGERLPGVAGERVFARSLWALEKAALQITGAVQRGSLPVYLGTALAVLVGAQTAAVLTDPPWTHPVRVRWADSVAQLAVAAGVCAVALLCVAARNRMRAVVLAGVTGYGTAVLYVVHGAPDVALTQFAVETVSVVVFVLVLRRLPARFERARGTPAPRRAAHLVLGTASGVFAAGLVYVAGAARRSPSAGPELTAATGHERLKNVVSTALVDLRSWDTMGESAVLAVAAVGVTSLVFLRRRAGGPAEPGQWPAAGRAPEPGRTAQPSAAHPAPGGRAYGHGPGGATRWPRPEPPPSSRHFGRRRARRGPPHVWPLPGRLAGARQRGAGAAAAPRRTWLAASATLAPERRSVIFEVVARLLFHPILVLSLYLLFCAENLPGGGFTAGLVAGLALAVRYLAGGRYELAAAAPVDAGFLLGVGLLTLTGTGLGGLVLGGSVLRSGVHHGELPLVGPYHAASPVLFDAGVYLLVVGVVLDVLRSLGSEVDRRVEREMQRRLGGRSAQRPAQQPTQSAQQPPDASRGPGEEPAP